jgi:hypothetical protein
MLDWLRSHDKILWWLIGLSVVTFVVSLLAVPRMVVRLPADYFARDEPYREPWEDRHPIIRITLVVAKNLLGIVLIAAGILMLVLPGQGVLTLLAGVLLLDFPGKHRLASWIVAKPPVLKSLNWIRARKGREPLVVRQTSS